MLPSPSLFLDANVLFSAAYREGNAIEYLFALAGAGHCVLLSSPFALEEARRNIAMKKPDRMQALMDLLRQVAPTLEPSQERITAMLQHGLPPKDAPILAAAITAKADALITGDRTHFGHLYGRVIDGVQVLTVGMVLEQLVSGQTAGEQ